MNKNDFVEVNVYTVDKTKEKYGGGIAFSVKEMDKIRLEASFKYEGKTLLTKEFFKKFANNDDEIYFIYVE